MQTRGENTAQPVFSPLYFAGYSYASPIQQAEHQTSNTSAHSYPTLHKFVRVRYLTPLI